VPGLVPGSNTVNSTRGPWGISFRPADE
jgi:hypothetical protein